MAWPIWESEATARVARGGGVGERRHVPMTFALSKSKDGLEFQRTMESENLRRWMVETQLRSRGIRDPRVLAAMSQVPREALVSPE